MFKMQRPYRAGITRRSAFSLAEVMIAIGILGIGMIMVAATFPVGLDQSRVVADETMKSAVAEEAFASLDLLIHDPSPEPRVYYRDSDDNLITDMPVTFRQALGDSLLTKPTVLNLPDPTLLSDTLVFRAIYISDLASATWQKRQLNIWLGSKNKLLGDELETLGPQLRRYPSLKTDYTDTEVPPFVWSVLFRKPSDPTPGQNVQFVVFVNRRSIMPLCWVKLAVNPKSHLIPVGEGAPPEDSNLEETINPTMHMELKWGPSLFNAGGYIVEPGGNILRIKSLLTKADDPSGPLIVLDDKLQNQEFWFVPADPTTGRSPCIGVFSRTLSLN